MKADEAGAFAEAIVRLVQDLERELDKDIQEFRAPDTSLMWRGRAVGYRNWMDTVVNGLPTKSFTEALWADVYGVRIGLAPMRQSPLMEAFVDKWRLVIAEWEFLGHVGD